ncbi:hypothetical protein [Oceanivirga miroungae]|uniref:hypothetical protein n=1 Tax=Oceanivirga miroungae TaxID=1130046 RepID=UPI0012E7CCBD|nr:hypothetical protein [Oceanivirga miroungae]
MININNVKINKAKLCRDLKISYNTLNKRIKNIPLKETRNKPSMIDQYKSEIVKLLEY